MVIGVVIGVRYMSGDEERVIGDAFEVQVVLEDSVSSSERVGIERRLERLSGNDARYISKREASRRAQALFKESPGISKNIQGNPFPATVQVSVETKAEWARINRVVGTMPGVRSVRDIDAVRRVVE